MAQRMYKIGEVAQLLNLKSYVLRFWETEFLQLVPERTEAGQRLYTEDNVNLLKNIRYLLHEQGLTIEGAKKILESQKDFNHLTQTGLGENNPVHMKDEHFSDVKHEFIAEHDEALEFMLENTVRELKLMRARLASCNNSSLKSE